ncbi:STAS domain-containing protein [bacterium]|nr:STAS domain-containing protein [bacterium]
MDSFEITVQELENVVIFGVKGYFAQEAGDELRRRAEPILKAEKFNIIVDLSACSIISSPGVAQLMDLTFSILDDYKGKVVICGLDALKTKVLKLAGIIPVVETCENLEESKEFFK